MHPQQHQFQQNQTQQPGYNYLPPNYGLQVFQQNSGFSYSSSSTQTNTRSCAKMELIQSYGLTLADINNLVRHAISAADNVHPSVMMNQVPTNNMDPNLQNGQGMNGIGEKDKGQGAKSKFQEKRGQFNQQGSTNGFEQQPGNGFNSRANYDREVKVGASVLTEKGNIYQGSNFEQPTSLLNSILGGDILGGTPPNSMGASNTGDDRLFIQAEDCAIMKAMIDGNNQIRAIAVHVKHMIPSINQQAMAVQQTYGYHPHPQMNPWGQMNPMPPQFHQFPPQQFPYNSQNPPNIAHDQMNLPNMPQTMGPPMFPSMPQQMPQNIFNMPPHQQNFQLTPRGLQQQMINQQSGFLQKAPILPNLGQVQSKVTISKPNTYEEPTNTEKLFIHETEPNDTEHCRSENQKRLQQPLALQSTRNINQMKLKQLNNQFSIPEGEKKQVKSVKVGEIDSPHDSPQLMLPIEKNSAQENLSVDKDKLSPAQLKENTKLIQQIQIPQHQNHIFSPINQEAAQNLLKMNTLPPQPENTDKQTNANGQKSASPRLKQHLMRKRAEQALLMQTNTPNYVPVMQIPIGKWRNNMIFNRIPAQIKQHTKSINPLQNCQNPSMQSPKFPPTHHFLMIICYSETSYVLKTSASIMAQNQIQNIFTNSFIAPTLNLDYSHFAHLSGNPPTTPRGSINISNMRLNLTGYRIESERLNFPNHLQIHSILDSANYWAQIDHNQETRREIESLLIQDNFRELTKRFRKRIKVHNSDIAINSKIGAGFSKINPITLQQFAHGVVEFMLNYQPKFPIEQDVFLKDETVKEFMMNQQKKKVDENSDTLQMPFFLSQSPSMMQELLANKGVVLGFDQKKRSSTIAKILAAVLKKYGGAQIHLLDKFTTPGFLSYYTKVFGCVMGIMVTCEPISQNSSSQSGNSGNGMQQGSHMAGMMSTMGGMYGPQSLPSNDKNNQFNQEANEYVKIQLFNGNGRPLNESLIHEIRMQMNEFILNNLSIPNISQSFDHASQKLKFVTSNFTDITIRKYINYIEKEFLISRSKNQTKPKNFIGFSCYQGPVNFFLKKVMANFSFQSPFNMLDVPVMAQSSFQNNFSQMGGVGKMQQSSMLSEYLVSNGAAQNFYSPQFCPKERLQRLLKMSQSKNSKIIIQTDPLGEQFVLFENLAEDSHDDTDNFSGWRQVSFQEIVVLVLEMIKEKNGAQFLEDKVVILNKNISLPLIERYSKESGLHIQDSNQVQFQAAHDKVILNIDYEQARMKILESQYDIVSICVLIAQAYKSNISFFDQVSQITQMEMSIFQSYPVTIQNQQIQWRDIFMNIVCNNSQPYQNLIHFGRNQCIETLLTPQHTFQNNQTLTNKAKAQAAGNNIKDKKDEKKIVCQIQKLVQSSLKMIQFTIQVSQQGFQKMNLTVNLILTSKYDAIFEVESINESQSNIFSQPEEEQIQFSMKEMLLKLIQISYNECQFQVKTVEQEQDRKFIPQAQIQTQLQPLKQSMVPNKEEVDDIIDHDQIKLDASPQKGPPIQSFVTVNDIPSKQNKKDDQKEVDKFQQFKPNLNLGKRFGNFNKKPFDQSNKDNHDDIINSPKQVHFQDELKSMKQGSAAERPSEMPWPKAILPITPRIQAHDVKQKLPEEPSKFQKTEDHDYTEMTLKITTQKSKNQMDKQISREKPLSGEKPSKIVLEEKDVFEIPRAPVSKRQRKESFKETGPRSLNGVKTMTTAESSNGTRKALHSIFQMPLKSPNMHCINNYNQNIGQHAGNNPIQQIGQTNFGLFGGGHQQMGQLFNQNMQTSNGSNPLSYHQQNIVPQDLQNNKQNIDKFSPSSGPKSQLLIQQNEQSHSLQMQKNPVNDPAQFHHQQMGHFQQPYMMMHQQPQFMGQQQFQPPIGLPNPAFPPPGFGHFPEQNYGGFPPGNFPPHGMMHPEQSSPMSNFAMPIMGGQKHQLKNTSMPYLIFL